MDKALEELMVDLPKLNTNRNGKDPAVYFQLYISKTSGMLQRDNILTQPQELYIWFVIEGEKKADDYSFYTYNFLEDRFEEVKLSELETFAKSIARPRIRTYEQRGWISLPLFRSILEHIVEVLMTPGIISIREANVICKFLKVASVPKDDIYQWDNLHDAWMKYSYDFIRHLDTDINKPGEGVLMREFIAHLKEQFELKPDGSANGNNYYRAYALALRDKVLKMNKLPSVMDYHYVNEDQRREIRY